MTAEEESTEEEGSTADENILANKRMGRCY